MSLKLCLAGGEGRRHLQAPPVSDQQPHGDIIEFPQLNPRQRWDLYRIDFLVFFASASQLSLLPDV
jgi:hypothetical protein